METNGIADEIFESTIRDITKRNVSNLDDYEIAYSSVCSKGDNYVGIVKRAEVKCKIDGSTKLSIIAKISPQNDTRREQFAISEIFSRESFFYDDICPLYKEFQLSKGIDIEKEGFKEIAHCHKVLTVEPYEGLFFEDLNSGGFEMYDRFKKVTKEHAFLVMRALGKFHATFFALRDQKPDLMEKYKKFTDIFTIQVENEKTIFKPWITSLKKPAIELLETCQNEDLVRRIRNIIDEKFLDHHNECTDPNNAEPYTVLTHGDTWTNNMMFHYDKNGTPDDIKLLDFQFVRYATPVLDLVYYLFASLDKGLRDLHYFDFLDVYHKTLSKFLARLGSNPEKVFPRKALDDHLKRFGKFGLILAVITIPVFTKEGSEVPDLDIAAEKFKQSKAENGEFDGNILNLTPSNNEAYKKRLMDVFEDVYNFGYV